MSDDLINSAVTFLQDPKVADAPLAKRIAFLESKGLSSEQVQAALQRAQDVQTGNLNTVPTSSTSQAAYVPSRPVTSYGTYQPMQQLQPPPLPQRDWRDWFIMAVVSGGFSWAAYFLAKRYVLPLISPPTPTQLESDKETISAQFDQVQEMLSILQKDTAETKDRSLEQGKKVEAALADVNEAVGDMKDKTARREADIRRIGLEVDQLREMIPKAIEAVKAAQGDALNDLQGELRSLKTLLQNRIKATSTPAFSNNNPPSNTPTPSQSSNNPATIPTSSSSSISKAQTLPTTGSSGGSVSQVAQTQATSPKASMTDPLARFTSRGGNGIPEWQKSAPGTTSLSETAAAAGTTEIAGSAAATAKNLENSETVATT